MAQPHQSMWSRLYRFCNDYPIVVFPLAVDLYRIVICKDYRRPTFTEFVLWIMAQCICWSTLLLTLAPIVHLAVRLLKRLLKLTVTMRDEYRNLEPSIRNALHRWNSGQDVAGWKMVTPFDWYSYAKYRNRIEIAVFCDTKPHTQPTEKVFYVQMHRSTRTLHFFEQSLADGALRLLHVCLIAGRRFFIKPFFSNDTLVVLLFRLVPAFVPTYDEASVICYHVQSNKLWRAMLPLTNEIGNPTITGNILSVSCDAQGLLASIHWSCHIKSRRDGPFRSSIRTDYYVPIEFQRMDNYYQVTLASRRTAEEMYMPDNSGSKTYHFYISNSLHGLRTKYMDRRDEEFLLCNPYDAENRYKLVKAVAWKELGRLCGPRQYRDVCEMLSLPLDMGTIIRESESEILTHIGGFNVIRTTFGQVQQCNVQQTGSMLFRLSAMFNEPPPPAIYELDQDDDDDDDDD